MRKNLLFACVLLLVAGLVFAQQIPSAPQPWPPQQPSITVTGEATVKARPDRAQIDIGVVSQAQTAQTAAADNARQLDRVMAQLKKELGPSANIRTINYSVTPNYRYPKEGGQPTITGYTATNTVEVTAGIGDVGKLIDLATQSGANNVQSLRFTLENEEAVHAQALREAATKARGQAEALADALHVRLIRVLHVVENQEGGIRPLMAMSAGMATRAAVPTPIEPGTIEVKASVTLAVEIAR